METNTLIQCNQMILIGATGRNSGKTTLASSIIDAYKNQVPIVAFKFIVVSNQNDICPRGGKGCGICNGLEDEFDITEELQEGNKDTMLLKKAGAKQVFLVRTFKDHIKESFEKALTYVPKNTLILCESNSIRHVVKPACFIMIHNKTSNIMKPSSKEVINYADVVLDKDYDEFSLFIKDKLSLYLNFQLLANTQL